MSRLHLTSWQQQGLRRQLAQTPDARLFCRTLAVLEFDRGRSAADIARMLGVTRQSVYHWVDLYTQALDPAALAEQAGRGRHPLLDEDHEHLLEALLGISPQDLGFPHAGWTLPLLRQVLALATDRNVSEDTLRRTLRRLDYVWKRPRYVLEPDPLREKKTPHSSADSRLATPQRRAGPGRNRCAALSAAACRLVQTRRGRRGSADRPQRPARRLRSHEPS